MTGCFATGRTCRSGPLSLSAARGYTTPQREPLESLSGHARLMSDVIS
jgi:hypothetical protein